MFKIEFLNKNEVPHPFFSESIVTMDACDPDPTVAPPTDRIQKRSVITRRRQTFVDLAFVSQYMVIAK